MLEPQPLAAQEQSVANAATQMSKLSNPHYSLKTRAYSFKRSLLSLKSPASRLRRFYGLWGPILVRFDFDQH